MRNIVFEEFHSKMGFYGLQSKAAKNGIVEGNKEGFTILMIAWRSPYASEKQNAWLENQLQKAYNKYYIKVMLDNYGLFW